MQELTIDVNGAAVSAIHLTPANPVACYVLAHGAGAGMRHRFMEATAHELCELGIATLRFQFPYMERGSKRPDPPALCHAAIRAAVAKATELSPRIPLIAGGRSFGGRMTSQAQAETPLANVRGLVFLGFPLHPAGKPDTSRAGHLDDVRIPMLFIQGTRDELAHLPLLEPVIAKLGPRATLHLLQDADHSFHVPVKTGRKDAEVRAEAHAALMQWLLANK
jgi:predicted alpha/beta-hydrolase family hydrolase